MSKLLEKLYLATGLGIVLVMFASFGLHQDMARISAEQYTVGVMTFLHVISGILWIGLLWYFNLVQIPTMPTVPAELKPGVTKFIAPRALFWFRYAALATALTGLLLAGMKGYLLQALTFQQPAVTIGIGIWGALIMATNVWVIIWPNQKKALGIVAVDDAAKAKAARLAMLASRFNFVLSLPVLYCMVGQGLIG